MTDPFSSARIELVDKSRVRDTYMAWPDLAADAFEKAAGIEDRGYRKVYVLGMGGSAAAGDLLGGWLLSRHGVEAEVCKGVIPASDMTGTLGIVCSASGETEETLSMLKTAEDRHATLVCISHGGRLADAAKKRGIRHVQLPEIVAPRFMLPSMVFSCLKVLDSALGVDSSADAREAIDGMRKLQGRIGVDVPLGENPSKEVAVRLMKATASVYGTRVTRGVGVRFKNEMNEVSKRHAVYDEMPELFHNEIEAWEQAGTDFVPVLVRESAESERDGRLADAFTAILTSMGKGPIQVRGVGRSLLARLAGMVYELDLASYYVAIGVGQDPLPTPLIARLKKAV